MPNMDDYVNHLRNGSPTDRTATVKLDGEVVEILEKYRRPTTIAGGRHGRLQPLCEVAADLIRLADQSIREIAGKQPPKRAGKGSSDSSGESAKS